MKFRDHILAYVLIPLLMLLVCCSYYRFVRVNDYQVGYEGTCDPTLHSCFTGCNDDACTDTYYYDKVEKYAVDLKAECGTDITDCAAANTCLPTGDRKCSITYCDPGVDGEDTCEATTPPPPAPPVATTTDDTKKP